MKRLLLSRLLMLAALFACGDGPPWGLGPGQPNLGSVWPQVWSQNAFDGQSYEFKTNCGTDHIELETCFLWDVTEVIVEAPDGDLFELEKDFNINGYSGEVTRRWVLYGPVGAGLPGAGEYRFLYYRGEELALTQVVAYQPETVGFPTDVVWVREGDDLVVSWTPPAGASPGMHYKVLMFPDGGSVISLIFDWDASHARLSDVPLPDGATGTLNVAIFFDGGFSPSRYLPFTW